MLSESGLLAVIYTLSSHNNVAGTNYISNFWPWANEENANVWTKQTVCARFMFGFEFGPEYVRRWFDNAKCTRTIFEMNFCVKIFEISSSTSIFAVVLFSHTSLSFHILSCETSETNTQKNNEKKNDWKNQSLCPFVQVNPQKWFAVSKLGPNCFSKWFISFLGFSFEFEVSLCVCFFSFVKCWNSNSKQWCDHNRLLKSTCLNR